MKEGYTHITVILDRSGSMSSIADDVIGGFNTFVQAQREAPGEATLSLVQFDTVDAYEVVYSMTPIGDVRPLTRAAFVPRGGTPLLDAMGRGILELEGILAGMDTADRPAKVVMLFVTDGQENSSREFSKSQVVKMVGEKQSGAAPWEMVFMSADLGAIDEAGGLQFQARARLAFDANSAGVRGAFSSFSAACLRARVADRAPLEFTQEERDQQEQERRRRDQGK